jgi:Skp family chaperone for outer membrane proteins
MKVQNLVLTGMFFGFAAVVFMCLGDTHAEEDKDKVSLAFVNIKTVIDNYDKTIHLEEKIDALRSERSGEIDAMEEKVMAQSAELATLDPGSMTYKRIRDEQIKLECLVKYEEDRLRRDVELALLKATKAIYEEIAVECEKIRRERKYTAILKVETGMIESESKAELILKINSRAILSHDAGKDITKDVTERLNGNYKK